MSPVVAIAAGSWTHVRQPSGSARGLVWSVLVLVLHIAPGAAAQGPILRVTVDGLPAQPMAEVGLAVVVDADDDDEDGVIDAMQLSRVPAESMRSVRVEAPGEARLSVTGPLRLVVDGAPSGQAVTLAAGRLPAVVHLQGLAASRTAGDAALTVQAGTERLTLPVTVVGLAVLDGRNRPLSAATDAVGASHRITNDASLPRRVRWGDVSPDPDNLRLEVHDPSVDGAVTATLESVDARTGQRRAMRSLALSRPRAQRPFRSQFLRLVGDEMDAEAPGVGDRVVRVALRDIVRMGYDTPSGPLSQSIRVGRPGDEDGPEAARRARLRIRVLRQVRGGAPVMGADDRGALAIAREQVRIANEIWLQCFVDFGDPEEADVAIVDPPMRATLSVGDGDGLPARGGGQISFSAAGRAVHVPSIANASPVQTAMDIAAALRAMGLVATVRESPATEFAAGRAADVSVRDGRGAPVLLDPEPGRPLSTDARQSVTLAEVDLADGLQEFDNMTAAAGTLEERALAHGLDDGDPTTIDILVVNRFTGGTRQGEAFIEADGGTIVNTLILDRNGVLQQRQAWTQAHEIGHVLLDQPFHPDNVGPDRPWLLMDADSSMGFVTGPKRLGSDECARARDRSGSGTVPVLLDRLDARPATPPRPRTPFDRGYPR